jgi:hypothetical protein
MRPDPHPPVPDARPGPPAGPTLRELRLADDPRAWARLGFTVADGACRIGDVVLRFEPPRAGVRGIVSWTLVGARAGTDIDGLATEVALAGSGAGDPPPGGHANGGLLVDHVVVTTPDLERTFAALHRAGLELRRVREAGVAPPAMQQAGLPDVRLRQGFYRLGAPVLEVVGPGRPGPRADAPAAFWGLVVTVGDLEVCAEIAGEHVGAPRDAVQPGRRIATVRRSAGLALPMAFITPGSRDR